MEHFKLIITIVDRGKGGKAVDLYRKHHLHFDFACNPLLKTQWLRLEPAKAAGLEFSETLRRLEQFLHPVYQAVLRDEDFDGQWFSSQKSWTCSNR